jgi:hypothetical protein
MSQNISLSVDIQKPSPKLWSVYKEWGDQIAEVAADSHFTALTIWGRPTGRRMNYIVAFRQMLLEIIPGLPHPLQLREFATGFIHVDDRYLDCLRLLPPSRACFPWRTADTTLTA